MVSRSGGDSVEIVEAPPGTLQDVAGSSSGIIYVVPYHIDAN